MKLNMRSQFGVSMIEVLVSLTVVAFGLLGLAGLQARSMSFHKDSIDRKAAAEAAAQLTERVRANYDGFRQGFYRLTMEPADAVPALAACADVNSCTPLEIANRDIAMWAAEVRRRLPASGAYLSSPNDLRRLDVVVAWQEGQAAGSGVDADCPATLLDDSFRCLAWTVHP